MDGVEVKLQQLLKHLKVANNKALSPLASKVCCNQMPCSVVKCYGIVINEWSPLKIECHIIIIVSYYHRCVILSSLCHMHRRSGSHCMKNLPWVILRLIRSGIKVILDDEVLLILALDTQASGKDVNGWFGPTDHQWCPNAQQFCSTPLFRSEFSHTRSIGDKPQSIKVRCW